MYAEKLVITGMGAVTPIGNTVKEYWESLKRGVSGVRGITRFDASKLDVRIAAEVKNFEPERCMPKKLARTSPLFMQYAFAAADEAIAESGLGEQEREKTGIVFGTSMGGICTVAETQAKFLSGHRAGPRFIPVSISNAAAASIAIPQKLGGPSFTVSTACSSGGDAVMTAAMLILSGEAEAIAAVGADSVLCPVVVSGLASSGALSKNNSEPGHACRPFDVNRDGFVIGEGAGAMVIETETHALRRGAPVHAYLAGWANTSDAYHITAPRPDGRAAAACMRKAVSKSGLGLSEIGYINAHGTSTVIGDKAETEAVKLLFGGNVPPVSSTKSMTGHMMGAGGITEAIACVMAVKEGVLPPTVNLDNPAPECGLNHIRDKSMDRSIKAAMSNSFGFGGQNSSVVILKYSGRGV